MSEQLICWRFHAVDSWFFRETRAHDAVGVSELSSVFPPPARTLMGAIRTWLGDQLGVDWHAFARGEAEPALQALLGDAERLGELSLAAAVLRHRGEVLWPCPADVMLGERDGKVHVSRLVPGSAVDTDLGRVALPMVATGTPPGSKAVQDAWLTGKGMMTWLGGGVPTAEQIVKLEDLIEEEPRLGIGRDNALGTVKQGLLYQTRHLRLRDESTCVEAWVSGIPRAVIRDATSRLTLRLGGEGRMANVTLSEQAGLPLPEAPRAKDGGMAGKKIRQGKRLALWLVAPALIAEADANSGLPGFMPTTTADGVDVWEGELEGVALRLVSCCRPRAHREGGWDQRLRQPRAVRSYLPPGTVLFCEILDDTPMAQALERLHGSQIGADRDWGKGRMLASAIEWPSA